MFCSFELGQFLSCHQLISKSLSVNSRKQCTISMMPSTRNLYRGVERNFHLKENSYCMIASR
nr:hypothetical protein Itr_chr13CG17950 [Ipomoea trifida]